MRARRTNTHTHHKILSWRHDPSSAYSLSHWRRVFFIRMREGKCCLYILSRGKRPWWRAAAADASLTLRKMHSMSRGHYNCLVVSSCFFLFSSRSTTEWHATVNFRLIIAAVRKTKESQPRASANFVFKEIRQPPPSFFPRSSLEFPFLKNYGVLIILLHTRKEKPFCVLKILPRGVDVNR